MPDAWFVSCFNVDKACVRCVHDNRVVNYQVESTAYSNGVINYHAPSSSSNT